MDIIWSPLTVALATLAMTVGVFTIVWAIHVPLKDAGIVDYWWGPGFAVMAVMTAWLAGHFAPTELIFIACVALWAARLGIYMAVRHRKMDGEDARYAAMRVDAGPNWWWQNLAIVFWLQAVIQWIVATPIHAALLYPGETDAALFGLGGLMFIAGFAIEVRADSEIARFKANPANRGRLLTTGLFAWTRHPNYFGEATLWWGLGLMALASTGLWWSLVGPAILTFLLLKVSGVTLLDKHLASRPGWAAYAARTPAFFPRPPRPEPAIAE